MESEIAFSIGNSACDWKILIPIPTTTPEGDFSLKMPANFLSFINRSFGHLISTKFEFMCLLIALATANPVINGIQPSSSFISTQNENVSPLRAGISNLRSNLPRPAL